MPPKSNPGTLPANDNPHSAFPNPQSPIHGIALKEYLVAETELGPVKFTKPIAYQELDGKRVEVECKYTIAECVKSLGFGFQGLDFSPIPQSEFQNPHLEYGFTVASYDRTKDLVIDPLMASTYLGGNANDEGYSLAIDSNDYVYVAGTTYSSDFPTTSGVYDISFNSNSDVFVTKLNNGLTSLRASTFLGGDLFDKGISLAFGYDANNNIVVYVTGQTYSSSFPTTSGAYDTSYNGYYDVFVSKLNSSFTSLQASTYLGGTHSDYGRSITLNSNGHVFVTGYTDSNNFPTTNNAYDTTYSGGNNDAFVSMLDANLTLQ